MTQIFISNIYSVFLGYSLFHKRYKCLYPSGCLYIARSVSFDELSFPYPSFCSSPSPPPASFKQHISAPPFVLPSLPSTSSHPSCSSPISSSATSLTTTATTEVPLISVPLCSTQSCSSPSPSLVSNHHMQTRSKSGIFKPKLISLFLLITLNHAMFQRLLLIYVGSMPWMLNSLLS